MRQFNLCLWLHKREYKPSRNIQTWRKWHDRPHQRICCSAWHKQPSRRRPFSCTLPWTRKQALTATFAAAGPGANSVELLKAGYLIHPAGDGGQSFCSASPNHSPKRRLAGIVRTSQFVSGPIRGSASSVVRSMSMPIRKRCTRSWPAAAVAEPAREREFASAQGTSSDVQFWRSAFATSSKWKSNNHSLGRHCCHHRSKDGPFSLNGRAKLLSPNCWTCKSHTCKFWQPGRSFADFAFTFFSIL